MKPSSLFNKMLCAFFALTQLGSAAMSQVARADVQQSEALRILSVKLDQNKKDLNKDQASLEDLKAKLKSVEGTKTTLIYVTGAAAIVTVAAAAYFVHSGSFFTNEGFLGTIFGLGGGGTALGVGAATGIWASVDAARARAISEQIERKETQIQSALDEIEAEQKALKSADGT